MIVLPDVYTSADVASFLNAWAAFGGTGILLVVLLLGVIAFRGR